MAQTPEAKVKAKIKKWLNGQGIYHFSPIGSAFGTHGVPDIICCAGGKFVAIEVKAPGKLGTLTENQKRHIEEIRDAGGVAVVADDLAIVVDVLNHIV
jgi:Holliday junction resolvase